MGAAQTASVMKATEVILDGFDVPNVSNDALTRLTKILGAESAIIFGINVGARTMESLNCEHHLMFGEVLGDYRRTYFYYDPCLASVFSPTGRAAAQGHVQRLSDVAPSLIETAYYNDFLRKIDIKHKLALLVPSRHDSRRVFAFGFHRPRALTNFGDAECQLLERLRPALSSVVDRAVLQELLSRKSSIIDELSMGLKPGILLILGEDCAIQHANSAAQRLLGDTGWPNRIPQSILNACDRVRLQKDSGAVEAAVIGLSDDMQPIEVSIRYSSNDNVGRFLISSNSDPLRPECTADRLAQFNISRREAQIIQQIVFGNSNKIIARNLDISARTVENHIRAIYLKMDVNSRAHMISKIYELRP